MSLPSIAARAPVTVVAPASVPASVPASAPGRTGRDDESMRAVETAIALLAIGAAALLSLAQ